MVSLAEILTIVILGLDFAFSIWNSYTAGYNFGMLKKMGTPRSKFVQVLSVLGLAIGLVGLIYVIAIVISFILYYFAYIGVDTINLLLAYNFIIFGGLITFLGIGIMIQSWIVAIRTHNKWSIVLAIWNTIASIWNLYNYISNFSAVTGVIKSETKSGKANQGTILVIFAVAIAVAVALCYIVFRAGEKKALKANTS